MKKIFKSKTKKYDTKKYIYVSSEKLNDDGTYDSDESYTEKDSSFITILKSLLNKFSINININL